MAERNKIILLLVLIPPCHSVAKVYVIILCFILAKWNQINFLKVQNRYLYFMGCGHHKNMKPRITAESHLSGYIWRRFNQKNIAKNDSFKYKKPSWLFTEADNTMRAVYGTLVSLPDVCPFITTSTETCCMIFPNRNSVFQMVWVKLQASWQT